MLLRTNSTSSTAQSVHYAPSTPTPPTPPLPHSTGFTVKQVNVEHFLRNKFVISVGLLQHKNVTYDELLLRPIYLGFNTFVIL